MFPMPDDYGDPLASLSDEDRKRFLEQFPASPVHTGAMTRGAQGFSPLPVPRGALGPDREALAPAAPPPPADGLMARFMAAQQKGAGNATFANLGGRLDNYARIYAGLPERQVDTDGMRQRPVSDLMAQEGLKQQERQRTRQTELDAVNLDKTRAETTKAQASARATEADEKREAALADPKSPESASLRATATELLKGRVSPETLSTMSGVQIRDALKFGTSQINAESMAGYRSESLRTQDENADAARKLQAYALQQGWDIARLTLEQRERLAAEEARIKAEADSTRRGDRNVDLESKYRTELLGLQPIREYQLAAVGRDKVRAAAKDLSGAGSLALIFGYMKTLDPTSTVREGEFANAQNAGGIPERVRNAWNGALNGNKLTPEMRAEFIASAEGQFNAYRQRAVQLIGGYRKLATDSGLDPSRIILDGLVVEDDAPPPVEDPPLSGLSSTRPKRAPMPSGELGGTPKPATGGKVTLHWSTGGTTEVPAARAQKLVKEQPERFSLKPFPPEKVRKKQYSKARNQTRTVDGNGKVLLIEDGDTSGK